MVRQLWADRAQHLAPVELRLGPRILGNDQRPADLTERPILRHRHAAFP